MRVSTVVTLAFAVGLGGLPLDAGAAHTETFHATLVGSAEVPPNSSTASGTATLVLNADSTVTYAVNATAFETPFRFAHVHTGRAGVGGPILFFLECAAGDDGTACTGTSPVLTASDLDRLASGGLYVNLHSDAFPGGEIRGQLGSLAVVPVSTAATVMRFAGQATGLRAGKGVELRMKGRFSVDAPVDLRGSTAAIAVLLDETGGAGELVANAAGQATPPVPLVQADPKEHEKEAVYQSASGAGDPRCRLKLKRKDAGLFEFELDCKRSRDITIPVPPAACAAGARQATLRTWLVLNLGRTIGVDVTRPWRCVGRNGKLRELKAVELKNAAEGGGATADNRPPKADFRAEPRSGTAPLTVRFENRSEDPDGDALSFAWDFGDGTSSAEREPAHVYETPGEFEVRLVVRDARGAVSAPKRDHIEVRPAG
jgi:hypothetical protein